MKIKVYNKDGILKVTKMVGKAEQVMFSDIQPGQVAEIEIEANISYSAHLRGDKKYAEMDNTEIRKISYEECPLKCTSCSALCNEMPVGQCRKNLSQAFDTMEN